MNIVKKLLKKLFHHPSPDKEAMDYAYAHGFRSGSNFHYNSGFPIDANLPWLISVGDNVTLATGVKLLAHDASTPHVGVHTKIGIVQIGNNVFIGANSIVLCNTRIGDNVIVGAGSVISPQTVFMPGALLNLFALLKNLQQNIKQITILILAFHSTSGMSGLPLLLRNGIT